MTTRAPAGNDPKRWRVFASYVLMVVLPVAAVLLILHYGAGHPAGAAQSEAPPALSDRAGHVLLAAMVVVATAGLLGLAARAAGQSAVVGEIVAGLVLGPSVLGALAPDLQRAVFPADIAPVLSGLAQFGVIFFMFFIGMELPLTMLRRIGYSALSLGHAAIAVPLLLGTLLALLLRERYQPAGMHTTPFLLFVALAVSVTAFPVLARILSDRGLTGTRLGTLGLAIAGVGDVTAWCVLGVVIAQVRSDSLLGVVWTVAELLLFAAFLWFVVRPLLARGVRALESRWEGPLPIGTLITFFVVLCAVVTNAIGVHAIFGAFLAGVIMPRSSVTLAHFTARTEGLAVWLLLPFFFVAVGLQTRIQSVFTANAAWALVAVLTVAVLGKVGGTFTAAVLAGESTRDALGLGTMMNCRGLTELVVLEVGLSLGVLKPELFSVLVVMTVLTTVTTDPLLRLLRLDRDPTDRRGGLLPAPVAVDTQTKSGT